MFNSTSVLASVTLGLIIPFAAGACEVASGSQGRSEYSVTVDVTANSGTTVIVQAVFDFVGAGQAWARMEVDGRQCDPSGGGDRRSDLRPGNDHVRLSCRVPQGRHEVRVTRGNSNATNLHMNFCGVGYDLLD